MRIPLFLLLLLLLLLQPLSPAIADVGTATYYRPPYLPTACYGSDKGQFPADNLFAAAGEGIWDNGASCGRKYLVRCLSSASRGACAPGAGAIRVVVVDKAASRGATLVLSKDAFGMIAALSAGVINIEFAQ